MEGQVAGAGGRGGGLSVSWDAKTGSLDLQTLAAFYDGGGEPTDVIEAVYDRLAARGEDAAWIAKVPREAALAAARALSRDKRGAQPLWGVPFGVKDNFDLAGYETTHGCRARATMATTTMPIVQGLIDAGAIPIGKNNMDQFGVGLNGTRTDYGIPRCVFDDRYISGGSTSGGGVAVAAGVVSFALGGDAAGSGRVPAALNNIVGLKPTPGTVPSTGIPSQAGMVGSHSLLTLNMADAIVATEVLYGHDPNDPLSKPEGATLQLAPSPPLPARFRFAVPDASSRRFAGDAEAERLFDEAVARLKSLGGEAVETDLEIYLAAAKELYEGPFIAQRTATLGPFMEAHGDKVFPATREIVSWGTKWSAMDLFKAQYAMAGVRQKARALLREVAFLAVPTTPTTVTVEAMLADNIAQNAMLGTYTNFVNLLDLPAISVPAGFRADGLPQGLMLIGPSLGDARLAAFAALYEQATGLSMGATGAPLPA